MASTNKTENFELNQWVGTDPVLMTDFNRDNRLIDAAMAKCGNCRIVTGSYVGTGVYGSKNHSSLVFDGTPLFVCVGTDAYAFRVMGGTATRYAAYSSSDTFSMSFTWSGSTLEWWSNNSVSAQSNASGVEYTYMALIAADE